MQGPFPFHEGESVPVGLAETGQTVGLPQEIARADRSAVAPEVLAEVGVSTVAPQELGVAGPSTQEQGIGSKQPRSDEVERGSRGSPPQMHLPPDDAEVRYRILYFFCFGRISS